MNTLYIIFEYWNIGTLDILFITNNLKSAKYSNIKLFERLQELSFYSNIFLTLKKALRKSINPQEIRTRN